MLADETPSSSPTTDEAAEDAPREAAERGRILKSGGATGAGLLDVMDAAGESATEGVEGREGRVGGVPEGAAAGGATSGAGTCVASLTAGL